MCCKFLNINYISFLKSPFLSIFNIFYVQVTFLYFHWIRGSPDFKTQGEYNAYTLYEQIDAGVPWTNTKKYLMLMPTLINYIACHTADYKPINVVVNCGIFLICIIAKIPEMHLVRIFGINSSITVDKPVRPVEKYKRKYK